MQVQVPRFVRAAQKKARAARLALALSARYGPEEVSRRLRLVDSFQVSRNGQNRLPPELPLGVVLADHDGIAALRPSPVTGRPDGASAVGVFHHPRNFTALLLGDRETQMPGRTREATLLLRAIPASAERFHEQARRLKGHVPSERREAFANDFLAPLSGIVVPRGDQHHPFLRRELVVWVPLATALQRVKGELTALLDAQPLTTGEVGALISAAWFGRPMPSALQGGPREIMWRAAPFDPQPVSGGFEGSGERFVFFYLEPRLDEEGRALRRLLELGVDLLLHLELVHNQLAAQLLARGRDNVSGRARFLRQRLGEVCDVVKPLTDGDDVVRAHWAFQPGGAHCEHFGHFPVANATLLINGLTATISRPHLDGNIFVGIELGGPRWLLELGTGAGGGTQHLLFVGKGSSGKTTLMNLVSPQIGGTRVLAFNFNPSPLEAFPVICHRWGPQTSPRDLPTKSGEVAPGIHLLCRPGTEEEPPTREYVAYFATDPQRGLEAVFCEEVVPAVRAFVENLRIPEDFPVSLRPLPGCNPALYAATVSLAWGGIDPWGQNQLQGLRDRWAEFAGPDDHLVLRLDDVAQLPEHRSEDVASLFGQTVRKMAYDATSGAHKDNTHVLMGCQSWGDLEHFPAGTATRFHLAFVVEATERSGIARHMVRVVDPDKPDETIAHLVGDVEHAPLRALLTRREKARK